MQYHVVNFKDKSDGSGFIVLYRVSSVALPEEFAEPGMELCVPGVNISIKLFRDILSMPGEYQISTHRAPISNLGRLDQYKIGRSGQFNIDVRYLSIYPITDYIPAKLSDIKDLDPPVE